MSCENKLWRITLDTNPEDCNYHCIMCEEHSEFSCFRERLKRETGVDRRRMPVAWLQPIFEQAAELGVTEIIPSTMGEPLLYEGIEEFYRLAKKHGMKVNLTTNGSFPRKPIAEWAKIIIPNTSDVKISINGAKKETSEAIMKNSNFNHQLDCIKHLVSYRNDYAMRTGVYCRITLQLTFMQNNMNELAGIVKMAAAMDVDRIKGHHLWTHFDELKHLSMKENPQTIALWNRYVDEALEAQKSHLRPNGKMVKLENIGYLDDESTKKVPEETECPFLNRELWISAVGAISPCCAPDEQRKTLGDFGNIQTSSLSEVIRGEKYLELVKNYKSKELCKNCNMRR